MKELGSEGVNQVMTPACCYHLYPMLAGKRYAKPQMISVAGPCFRNEEKMVPFQRLRAFRMREIVCVGSSDDVSRFLHACRNKLLQAVRDWGIPHQLVVANDPFFGGRSNPKALLQHLDPVKHELRFLDQHRGIDLAIASLNRHRTFFGDAFNIRLAAGGAASTGCFAFGLERWLFTFQQTFGNDVGNWPSLTPTREAVCAFS